MVGWNPQHLKHSQDWSSLPWWETQAVECQLAGVTKDPQRQDAEVRLEGRCTALAQWRVEAYAHTIDGAGGTPSLMTTGDDRGVESTLHLSLCLWNEHCRTGEARGVVTSRQAPVLRLTL